MAIRHDIGARLIQAGGRRLTRPAPDLRFSGADLPPPEAIRAETEAGEIAVQVYRPADAGADAPVYINFHGGGFVIRAPEQDDHICRHIAAELGCVVLNVDYDVAPQARFPVAARQAQAVCWWASFAGRKLGWDGKRIAIGGHSAGANLAVGACLDLPARMGFKPRGVVAVCAPLDLATPPEEKPAPIPRPLISPRLARLFHEAYLPDRAGRAAPLASPLLAESLKGFPAALVVVAGHDRLRAEGEAFAARLGAEGGDARLHVAEGVDHGYLQAGPRAQVARTLEAITAFLAPRLGPAPARS